VERIYGVLIFFVSMATFIAIIYFSGIITDGIMKTIVKDKKKLETYEHYNPPSRSDPDGGYEERYKDKGSELLSTIILFIVLGFFVFL